MNSGLRNDECAELLLLHLVHTVGLFWSFKNRFQVCSSSDNLEIVVSFFSNYRYGLNRHVQKSGCYISPFWIARIESPGTLRSPFLCNFDIRVLCSLFPAYNTHNLSLSVWLAARFSLIPFKIFIVNCWYKTKHLLSRRIYLQIAFH
jgi:hypothetical protein